MKKRVTVMVMSAVLLFCSAGKTLAETEQPAELDAKIASLAERISAVPGMAKGGRIAVLPFLEQQSGSADPFGKYVSKGLLAYLARTGRFDVVGNELLDKLLDEHGLGMPGVSDDAAAKKVGKVLGVGAVVTGTYTTLDSRVKISARVISVESGAIIVTSDTILNRSKKVEQLLVAKGAAELGAPQAAAPSRPAVAPKKNVKGATTVTISPRDGSFLPVDSILPAHHRGCSIPLLDAKPAGIVREPVYTGSIRKYGIMRLGTTRNIIFFFALDITPGKYAALYFDKNQNGDLADDGGPIMNQGNPSAYFAGGLTLPFSRVLDNVNFPEYRGWLFIDETSWHRNLMCYYSATQLKGKVTVDGTSYLAYIVDSDVNDADYTNDGIYIDLNQDQRIDATTEYISPGSAATINGKNYFFSISTGEGGRRVLFQDPAIGPNDLAKILKVTLVGETKHSLVFDVEYFLSEKFKGKATIGIYPDMPYWIVSATHAYPGSHTVSIQVDLHFDAKVKKRTVNSSTLRFEIDSYKDFSYTGEIFRRIVLFEKQWEKL
jgi:TolB-like protein